MCYKCKVTGLQLDDSSAEEMFYCGVLNEKKDCMNCSNSKYEVSPVYNHITKSRACKKATL